MLGGSWEGAAWMPHCAAHQLLSFSRLVKQDLATWKPWLPYSPCPSDLLPLFLLVRSVPWETDILWARTLSPGWVSGFPSGYKSEKHVYLLDFDVSTLVCKCLLLQCLENEDEVSPLPLTVLGMNSLVTPNSFGVYGNIIWSSIDIP